MAVAADTTQVSIGEVVSLWRHPVKSMMGEELNSTYITKRGVLGDRAYALIDPDTGMVASAKNPKKWPNLFFCRAAFVEPPSPGKNLPPVRITLPDGTIATSDERALSSILSDAVGREVQFATTAPQDPSLEEYWPDIEGLDHRETVTDEKMPLGTFFDLSVMHVLTTATIDRLRELYPEGRFEVRRFRPNVVVKMDSDEKDFVENAWIDQTLAIGDEARIRLTGPCPRCVMTTLPQGDLPKDSGILRTAARHNNVNVGVYGEVLTEGMVRRGDPVRLE